MRPDTRAALLKYRRNKNAMTAEETRAEMAPSDYVEELIEIKETIMDFPLEQLPHLKMKIDILSTLLRKCLPDMKAIEIKNADERKPDSFDIHFTTVDGRVIDGHRTQ